MDQARVIATILEHPVAHRGKTYQLYGPKEYTFPEAFGRIAQHIIEVAKDHAAGVFSGTDEVIERITGQPPVGLEEFIRKHREAFQ